jgi:hypothetical protein
MYSLYILHITHSAYYTHAMYVVRGVCTAHVMYRVYGTDGVCCRTRKAHRELTYMGLCYTSQALGGGLVLYQVGALSLDCMKAQDAGVAGSMLGPCWVHAGSMLGPCWEHKGCWLYKVQA